MHYSESKYNITIVAITVENGFVLYNTATAFLATVLVWKKDGAYVRRAVVKIVERECIQT